MHKSVDKTVWLKVKQQQQQQHTNNNKSEQKATATNTVDAYHIRI